MDFKQHRELDRIDGEPTEFEWMVFPGFTTLQILIEIQKFMNTLGCEPERFQGRIIFKSMYNDIVWRDPKNEKVCVANSTLVAEFAKKFSLGHWSFFGSGSGTKWNATDTFKPGGERDRVAELMMVNLSESGHPIFRATSALERGTLKSKGGGKLSIHFCGDYDTVVAYFSHYCLCQSAQYLRSRSRLV